MSTKLAEKAVAADTLLVEKAGSEGKLWEIKIIQAGEGSSGFYPAEVLERDGAKAFPAGTRTLANHDSFEDLMNGSDIGRIMGGLVEGATYRDGALWGTWEANSKWREWVKENHKYVGVSINTPGQKEVGTIGDYTGNVVTALENGPYTSIDVVVAPGAGGGFTRMLESAREILKDYLHESSAPAVDTEKENERKSHMEIEELAKEVSDMKESLSAFITAATPLLETLKPVEIDPEAIAPTAAVKVAYEKVIEAKLPAKLRESVIARVEADPKVDVDAAIKEQTDFIESVKAEIAEDAGFVRESAPVAKDIKTVIPRGWKH